MNNMLRTLVFCTLSLCSSTGWGQQFPWQDTTKSLDARVDWLVDNLTLDEKLSLMVHHNPAIPHVGLPAYSWWNEALHGVGRAGLATVYPMPIALAATFDPSGIEFLFSLVANEARNKYHMAQDTGGTGDYTGLTFFTPNINIFRDPRWGRGMETYGEDPYLTAMMGRACVKGLQHAWAENYVGNPLITAACLKHFAVHSGPEGIRHEFDSRVSERDLRTTYLPAFEYIIKNTDVQQVMCGYNRLNGEPCCTNRRLFDILRNEWHYDGILVTDCWALNDAYETDTVIPRHRTHATAALAYGDAFGREVDLECGSGLPALREAVQQGLVPVSKVDNHLRRILRTRLAVTDEPKESEQQTEYDIDFLGFFTRSIVLLKNNGILPLRLDDSLRLEGPNMWDSLMPLGNYNGTPRHTVTIGEGLQNKPYCHRKLEGESDSSPSKRVLIYAGGLNPRLEGESDSSPSKLEGVDREAGRGRVLIYAGGLNPQLEGEELPVEKEGFFRGDRTLIELPNEQVEEIKAFKAQGYRVVLVLCTGSAIALENVIDLCDAVLVAWYGGEQMGNALRELLFGCRDDFGRLPVTFYRSTLDLPPFDDYHMQDRTYRYADRSHVEYPFGYGLSYSYHQLWGTPVVDEANFSVSGLVSQCATDCNAFLHRTVVQVYLKNDNDPDAPVKQLIAVKPIWTVSFEDKVPFSIQLDPFWFRQFNPQTGLLQEPMDGTQFTLQIGFSSDDRDLIDLPFIYHNRK